MILETILLAGLLYGGAKYWTRKEAQKKVSDRKPSQNKISPGKHSPQKLRKDKKELVVAYAELAEKQVEKYVKLCGLSTVLVGTGVLVNPFFTAVGLLFFLPPALFVLKRAYENFIRRRKLTLDLYETVFLPGLFVTGYFFTATFSYFLYLLSLKLLLKIKDNSCKNITDFLTGFSDKVWIVKENMEMEVPFSSIQQGDIISVKGGQIIPADGVVTFGFAAVDQHQLTGDALPMEKKVGDPVFSSTLVVNGTIHFRVERFGRETVVANIASILNQTIEYKTNKETVGDKVAGESILPTFALAIIAYPFTGGIGSLAVLASYIGADAQIFVPLSALNFMKASSLNGILIKDGRSLEYLSKVDTVIFDKTGTLTTEDLMVAEIYWSAPYKKKDILELAALAEKRQTHPIAKAILKEAEEWGIDVGNVDDISYEAGFGIKVQMPDYTIYAGSQRFMEMEHIDIPLEMQLRLRDCLNKGNSFILIAKDRKVAGGIEMKITIRPEVKKIMHYLKRKKKTIYMITGDTQHSAKAMAEELGIRHYFFETFPEQKAEIVDQLLDEGRTLCYIGDGINDSIAMKKAQVSISLSGASSIARDTAGIILLDGTLRNINKLFEIGTSFGTNINNSLALAIIPGLVNIGSVFFFHSGIYLALFLYYVSLPLNLANSFYPLAKFREKKFGLPLLTPPDQEEQFYTVPKFTLDKNNMKEFHKELKRFQENFQDCFSNREFRRHFNKYMNYQFSDLEYETNKSLALIVKNDQKQARPDLISDIQWDNEKLLSKYRDMVAGELGEPNGVVIFEEGGFAKEDSDFVGIGRQYSRSLAKVENCQVCVFTAYASSKGYAFLDSRLFLPENWFSDDYQKQREKCQVPDSLVFKTKPQLAAEMLTTLRDQIPFSWVLADSSYGKSPDFLRAVEACKGVIYFVSTTPDTLCWLNAPITRKKQYTYRGQLRGKTVLASPAEKPMTVAELAQSIHGFFWFRRMVSAGTKGPIEYEFTKRRIILAKNGLPDRAVWLIMQRTLDSKPICRYFISNAPLSTPLPSFIWLSGLPWAMEQCLEEGKGELRMDQYEDRTYSGWHHHMRITMLAHFFLWRLKSKAGKRSTEYEAYAA